MDAEGAHGARVSGQSWALKVPMDLSATLAIVLNIEREAIVAVVIEIRDVGNFLTA